MSSFDAPVRTLGLGCVVASVQILGRRSILASATWDEMWDEMWELEWELECPLYHQGIHYQGIHLGIQFRPTMSK